MAAPVLMTAQRSSATPLALVMVLLVLYASLYPFSGWRWPAGQALPTLLKLPWPPWLTPLDEAFNLAGYLPLGLLLFIAAVHGGWRARWALALAVLVPALLSYGAEVAQHFLPGRHPSLKDWAMNTLGALAGALLAAVLHRWGWLRRWRQLRQRWFTPHSAGALALLALWPVGLLFPAPLPWALGPDGARVRDAVLGLIDDVPWATTLATLLAAPATAPLPLSPLAERAAATLGLLSPVLLTFAVTRPGWHRLMLAGGALGAGFATMTLATLLNFGPAHALAWLTPSAKAALVGASVAALALLPVPRRLVQGLALMALAMLVVLVVQAPSDPYYAQNLAAWEQGRFIHFHGLAQWVGWLWPFAAMAWLLARLARRDAGGVMAV